MSDDIKPFHYKPPKKWRVCHRFTIGHPGDPYLTRLTLLKTPWFSIKLHQIFRPDEQEDLHDHPWTFFSVILLGHYLENTPYGYKRRFWFNWKRATDTHSIREVSRRPVWTLLFCGPECREWGFWVKGQFVLWTDYEKLYGA